MFGCRSIRFEILNFDYPLKWCLTGGGEPAITDVGFHYVLIKLDLTEKVQLNPPSGATSGRNMDWDKINLSRWFFLIGTW